MDFRGDCDRYALVLFEALEPQTVLVFERETIGSVCQLLGKRHPNQHECLQLTRRNYRQMLEAPQQFAALGADVHHLLGV